MFPTPVGMNRKKLIAQPERRYVPHTRGDEPCGRVGDTGDT